MLRDSDKELFGYIKYLLNSYFKNLVKIYNFRFFLKISYRDKTIGKI